jgi:hypothetical protein
MRFVPKSHLRYLRRRDAFPGPLAFFRGVTRNVLINHARDLVRIQVCCALLSMRLWTLLKTPPSTLQAKGRSASKRISPTALQSFFASHPSSAGIPGGVGGRVAMRLPPGRVDDRNVIDRRRSEEWQPGMPSYPGLPGRSVSSGEPPHLSRVSGLCFFRSPRPTWPKAFVGS